MGIVISAAITSFICAILVMVRVKMNRNVGTSSSIDYAWKGKASRSKAGHRLRRIAAADLPHALAPGAELTVFHLIENGAPNDPIVWGCSDVFVTLSQLEEAIPWIPCATGIAVYRPGGFDRALTRRLSAIVRGREALLVSGNIVDVAERFQPMEARFQPVAGEICS
ncbi:MAG: hypothetical protein WAL56_09930 [Candidatus Sulfotelmatobacter sp.]|jgi:hypothetical protein